MSKEPDLEWQKREIATLVHDITECENKLGLQGVEIRDPDEWMQLRDIVARIERKLKAKMPIGVE